MFDYNRYMSRGVVLFLIGIGISSILWGLGKDDRALYWEYETSTILELIKIDRLPVAKKHLAILYRLFPDRKKEIAYYEAHVLFAEHNYQQAITLLQEAMQLPLTEFQQQRIQQMMIASLLRTSQFEEAIALLKKAPLSGIKGGWYGSLLAETTERILRDLQSKSVQEKITTEAQIVDTCKTFVQQFPENENIPFIKFFLAEYEYHQLLSLSQKFGRLEDEISPDVLQQKQLTLVTQLHQARKLYEEIQAQYPSHKIVERIRPRLILLQEALQNIKAAKSISHLY